MSHRASRCAASRCGTTTSSNDSPLLIARSEHLCEPVLDGGIEEPKPQASEPDVREDGVVSAPEPRERHTPDAQRSVRKTSERLRELVQLDRIVVDEEIPASWLSV